MMLPARRALPCVIAAMLFGAGSYLLWPRLQLVIVDRSLRDLPASASLTELRGPGQHWTSAGRWRGLREIQLALRPLSTHLDRAEARLGRTATSACLHARILLVLGQDDEAISLLRLAESLDPDDPAVAFAFGLALASRATSDGRASDYGSAAEAFQRAAESPESPAETFFNLALVAERIPAPHAAAKLWRKALSTERSPEWQRVIQRRKDAAEQFLRQRDSMIRDTLSVADAAHAAPGTVDLLSQRALTVWLSRRSEFMPELLRLSLFLSQSKHDVWLVQILGDPQTAIAGPLLSAAAAANLEGRHEAAAAFALNARTAYAGDEKSAGRLAAEIELAYAYARLERHAQCLDALRGVRERANLHSYRWLENRAWFEELTCKTQSRTVEVMEERVRAAREIPLSGYEGLGLRAQVAIAGPFRSLTTPADAWRNARTALLFYWQSVSPGIVAANFYVPLALASETAGQRRSATLLLEEAIDALVGYPNQRLKADLWNQLGAVQLRGARRQLAARSYQQAALLSPFPDEARRARAMAEVALAESDLEAGRITLALRRLEQLPSGDPYPYRNFGYYERLRLIPSLGDAFLASGQVQRALQHYRLATRECLDRLSTLRDRAQRQVTLRESEDAWRGIVAAQIRASDTSGALDSWQMFRSGRDPSFIQRTRPQPGTAWLSYAFLNTGVALWIEDSLGVDFHWIPDRGLSRAAERLSGLVATNDSPLELVHRISSDLYNMLIGPVSARIGTARILVIDADGPLARIPWAALENHAGQPLLLDHAIVRTHGWHEAAVRFTLGPLPLQPALIVADPAMDPIAARQLPPLLDARREASELGESLPGARLITGHHARIETIRALLPLHSLFHFAGHGLTNGGFGALVLAQDDGGPSQMLTAQQISTLELSSLQLVVLASCSSGIGELSGTFDLDSLVRAFLEAGARRVVSAHWDIASRPTAGLMHIFYSELLRGQCAAEALRTAALALRGQPTTAHPYYWAGFQLYGGP